ncbi:MAG: Ribonuclease HepT-like, partial [Deferribacteres bacterium]|nr:Ribonuclease HepT-like [Deferribacteres bacterium]
QFTPFVNFSRYHLVLPLTFFLPKNPVSFSGGIIQVQVGFRNIAVHDYNNLNIDIVINIVENHLNDFLQYMDEIKKNLS